MLFTLNPGIFTELHHWEKQFPKVNHMNLNCCLNTAQSVDMNYTRNDILDWISDNLEPEQVILYLGLTTEELLEVLEAEISEKLEIFDAVMTSCEDI